ncbi:MAG: two-component regulator propeller domain-containing protein [Myxococcota bacterium]|jgi:ligand-binding sensor domain-containing protein|nr:two-component regulator propeller domain-containing protein [Myxococcota bacterium]
MVSIVAALFAVLHSVSAVPAQPIIADEVLLDAHEVQALCAFDGRMWVGTRGGLLAYRDGQLERRLHQRNGLRQNGISALTWFAGELWVAFDDGGCQRLAEDGALSDCAPALEGLRLRAFARLPESDELYAASWDGQVCRVSTSEREDEQADPDPQVDGPATASKQVVECRDSGVPWLSAMALHEGELFLASRGRGLWRAAECGDFVQELNGVVDGLAVFGEALLVASGSGARLLGQVEGLQLPAGMKGRHATAAAVGEGSSLLLGFADGQVLLRRGELLYLERLEEAAFAAAFLGDEAWVGGGGALLRFTDAGTQRIELPGPGSADSAALAVYGDVLAVGTFRAGVGLCDGAACRRLGVDEGLPSNEVNALAYSENGELWVGTSQGLAVIGAQGSVRAALRDDLPCGHVNALVVDGPQLLVGTSCGVWLLDTETLELQQHWQREDGLPHRIVYSVAVWGELWVAGTNDGLAWRHRDDAPEVGWQVMRAGEEGLRDNWITAVQALDAQTLVVGTAAKGLFIWRQGGLPVAPKVAEGVAPMRINLGALQAVDGGMWVGTLGEGAFFLSTGHSDAELHPAPQGFAPSLDVTAWAAQGQRLWVATRHGVQEH